jgi:NAD+ kinase
MVATYEPNPDDELNVPVTDCFVHQLLDSHRRGSLLSKHAVHPGIANNNIPEDEETVHRHVQSRLLSKKQLSDMAFGIRELSKKLSHIKLRLKVHNIFILGKAHDDDVVKHTRELVCWLLNRDSEHKVYSSWIFSNSKAYDITDM